MMIPPQKSDWKSGIPARALLITAFGLIALINISRLIREDLQLQKIKGVQPHQKVGQKFYGLDKIFQGREYVGYYTDKDLSESENNKQFSQAQYIIAPTILHINNTDHTFTLFDCTSEDIALAKIQDMHATIIQKHGGLILTRQNP